MSRTADALRATLIRRLAPRPGAEDGFTLVEVLAALIVFALASAATAGMIVTGLRASLVAKLDTGAKNLAQERVETMRNMPFHIDHDPALADPALDRDDLLNTYYRNVTPAGGVNSTGFVAACGAQATVCAGRPAYEPQRGSYYRLVVDPVPDYPRYRQVITSQFIDEHRTPLGPPADYDSQKSGFDIPPSQIVAVTVTTFWRAGTIEKSYQLETYIAAGRPAASQITLQARAAALSLSTGLDLDRLLTYQAGLVSLDGALSSGSLAAGSARGAFADISGGGHVDGALLSAQAPPNIAAQSQNLGAQVLLDDGVPVARFGATTVRQVGASVTGGLPNVATAGSPTTGEITAHGPGIVAATLEPKVDVSPHLHVDQSKPVAWISQTTGSAPIARGDGYLTSTSGSTHFARAGAASTALALHLFPTTFAPDGVVRVTLGSAALTCHTPGTLAGAFATLTYSVTVEYWNPTTNTYTSVSANQTNNTDPLASVNLATTVVGKDSSSNPIYLGEYISSWGTLGVSGVNAGKKIEPDGRQVTASYTSVASITTHPLRTGEPNSGLSIELGQLSCIAEDNR